MGLFSTLESDAKSMVMSAEHFFGGLESEVADEIAPYVAKIRAAFTDELGYLTKDAWNATIAIVKAEVAKFQTQIATDPIGAISTVFSAVQAQLAADAKPAALLAIHGLVSALVAAAV